MLAPERVASANRLDAPGRRVGALRPSSALEVPATVDSSRPRSARPGCLLPPRFSECCGVPTRVVDNLKVPSRAWTSGNRAECAEHYVPHRPVPTGTPPARSNRRRALVNLSGRSPARGCHQAVLQGGGWPRAPAPSSRNRARSQSSRRLPAGDLQPHQHVKLHVTACRLGAFSRPTPWSSTSRRAPECNALPRIAFAGRLRGHADPAAADQGAGLLLGRSAAVAIVRPRRAIAPWPIDRGSSAHRRTPALWRRHAWRRTACAHGFDATTRRILEEALTTALAVATRHPHTLRTAAVRGPEL